ncbi:papain-like cysteine peptidase [Paenibacillus oenotherae]|uniref:Papain-like cysteine peptidase n=1 Tax=Paenibacillus oenotherae TaxID=1435645 RepID=A0ABS7D771_9BACL|nr:DUF1796 family putative cysteine peptidase [Paenibacillus oenotherae]MBW7475371.1 papain-like cysteine peptidase [Paenibacillus oenotherae]
MRLEQIKGEYNAVFSLGRKCLASIQLHKHHLRPYSGVLDWMISDDLCTVNLLLYNRFANFMELPNMKLEKAANGHIYRDHLYNILLVHDLPLDANEVHNLYYFDDFKVKLNRRIERFYEKAATCRKILFVRLGGSFDEAQQLQAILSQLVTHDFRVLLINDSPDYKIVDNNWPLEKVCSIQMPLEFECNELWHVVLQGITLQVE